MYREMRIEEGERGREEEEEGKGQGKGESATWVDAGAVAWFVVRTRMKPLWRFSELLSLTISGQLAVNVSFGSDTGSMQCAQFFNATPQVTLKIIHQPSRTSVCQSHLCQTEQRHQELCPKSNRRLLLHFSAYNFCL